MTIWTDFVKEYAAKNKMSYGAALSDPNIKTEYRAKNPAKESKPKPKAAEKPKEAEQAEMPPKVKVKKVKVGDKQYLKDKASDDLYDSETHAKVGKMTKCGKLNPCGC
jgi:hypothetical protein